MYVPTVLVTEEVLHRITIGDIVLTPGQWIQLAWLPGQRSRFVGVGPTGTFWGVHEHSREAFKLACDAFKRNVQRRQARKLTTRDHA